MDGFIREQFLIQLIWQFTRVPWISRYTPRQIER